MFDKFTSRNVKKIFKYPLSRPTTMSDQIVRLKRVLTLKFVGHFSGVSRTFWENYGRLMSMIVEPLGVYCTFLFSLPEPTWIVCLVFRQYSFHKEELAPWSSLDLAFPLLCFEYIHRTLPLFHLVPTYSLFLVYLEIQWIVADGDNSAMYKIKRPQAGPFHVYFQMISGQR